MMLGEESSSAQYWKQCGDEALAHNIKGVIIMVRSSITVVDHLFQTSPPFL